MGVHWSVLLIYLYNAGGDSMMTVKVVVSNLDYKQPYVRTSSPRFDRKCVAHQEWFNDPLVEQIVLDIDKTRHIKDYIFDSPVLGAIPPQMLSGGFKGLVLILKDLDGCRTFSSKIFGDNCAEWLRRLSFKVDFTILLCHPFRWCYEIKDSISTMNIRAHNQILAQTEDGRPLSTLEDVLFYYHNRFDDLWFANKDKYILSEQDYKDIEEAHSNPDDRVI